jgi:preprotein translocase subunit Sec63
MQMAANGDLAVDQSIDLYEVLEVDRKASSVDIRAAYRRLALAWHPGALAILLSAKLDAPTAIVTSVT